ncbi:alpha-(1,3)-fucosyltransferase C-like [Bacillus rossius redtenbacheri]|uniref:alpha-(1,3)-fucosyltransferase C-like n=1 Tax=Bacillus rossius redtenbacheri TaxID=93214 RepID=UPI002FDCD98F
MGRCAVAAALLFAAAAGAALYVLSSAWQRGGVERRTAPRPPPKKILFWNRFFRAGMWGFGAGRRGFARAGCPVDHCLVAERTAGSPAGARGFDAVVLHGWDLRVDSRDLEELRASRNPRQRYVFYLMEPPGVYRTRLKDFPGFFNWTMTYRRDSDVHRPYGIFLPRNGSLGRADNTTLAPAKKGLVAWFVSKCKTASRREDYVQELRKHVRVDVYGKCGNLKCRGRMSEECYRMLDRRYKFYLSFENSLCRDYATEKLFAVMRHDVVPVVYGGADYREVAPPGSYVDTNDFANPERLAEHLKYLDANPREYAKYLSWKRSYRVDRAPMSRAMCQLCAMLNDPSLPPKSYPSIHEWYSGAGVCRNAPSR